MIQKLKALGLALVAVFALSGVAASAASAQTIHSGSATGTTYLTYDSHGPITIDTELGSIICDILNGSSAYSGTTTSEITISSVSYSSCAAYGQTAHVTMNGCSYTVTGTNATTGSVQIVCPAGKRISVTPTQGGVAICHVDFAPQTLNLSITNTASTGGGTIPDDIDIRPESAVTYTSERTAGGSKCPTNGTHTDGTFTNYITVTGLQNSGHNERVGLTYT